MYPFTKRVSVAILVIGALCTVALSQNFASKSTLPPGAREFIEQTTRDYLHDNPEILLDVLAALKQQHEVQLEEKRHQAIQYKWATLYDSSWSPALGSKDADVTIVEFIDYRCPYCRHLEQSIQRLLGTDQKLRVVHKQLPILGRASVFAARLALVAHRLGKHPAYHAALMAKTGKIDEKAIIEVAQSVGLEYAQAGPLIDSAEISGALRSDIELAKELALSKTPDFVIGQEVIQGAPDVETLAEFVDQERRRRADSSTVSTTATEKKQ
jgi:protein-disulfide isomerase